MIQGEFTIVVEGASESNAAKVTDSEILDSLKRLIEGGIPPSAAAKSVAAELKIPKNRAYSLASELKQASESDAWRSGCYCSEAQQGVRLMT